VVLTIGCPAFGLPLYCTYLRIHLIDPSWFFNLHHLSAACMLSILSYYIQHSFICRPSDSTVATDAWIEPRTVATSALAVRHPNHEARSDPEKARTHSSYHLCLKNWKKMKSTSFGNRTTKKLDESLKHTLSQAFTVLSYQPPHTPPRFPIPMLSSLGKTVNT
jgi:hypothetical protein